MAAEPEPLIGIDLGTTNSLVATVQDGQPIIIKNRTGQPLTPSVVAVSKNGKRLVGGIAKRQAITNPQETVSAAKRLIGRKYSSHPVQDALRALTYQVVCGAHDDVRVRLAGRDLAVPEVSAMILAELKADAEAHFGRPVTQAVITVPAYFNDGQRQATKDAGRIAGLDVLRIINEPTAAALAYGFGRTVNGKIAVLDVGGGTFDVSVLEINNGIFDVVATGGDTFLGGEDWDHRIIEWMVFGFAKEHGIDLRKDRMALQRLKDAAEKAKVELSSVKEAQVHLPFICTPPGGGAALHLQSTLTREKLEELTADLGERLVGITSEVLGEAKVRPSDLKEVILVGGMSRMPRIVDQVRQYFRREPCKGVHAEEVVALGAAIQAYALVGQQSELLLLDVTPQSMGVAIAGGYVRRLIPRNTTVPTSATEVFATSKDFQRTVKIMVLQGEHELAHHNELLGEFLLTGLREAPRGQVEIEVTFDINAEGIVSVSARDRDTGLRQSITVTASSGLTEDELRRIMDEQRDWLVAARNTEELKAKRVELEILARDLVDALSRVRLMPGAGGLSPDVVARAEAALDSARQARGAEDVGALTRACEALAQSLPLLRSAGSRGTPGR
ncbi:molecular chaperone DnaK [Corallococcus sp. AB032C]|uniref:molecular chaperone DnaK n=1 Tax=Corallococcus TaxID=83461 RepID=UPI000EF051DD|nr:MULTISPECIES: molecular chaperone DnaK [Corallococcus]NPC48412.1 molecular chaperone DnaK [Corallococcus exiguus]RKH78203.1 molecular chaperone DnaK [Corallococcus sp. AB032C]